MIVIERATGQKKTAQYITTQSGNKRYSVDGKTYSDKAFDKKYGRLVENDVNIMIWKSHVRNLFEEILLNKDCWILEKPLRITLMILGAAAAHAAKIKDEKMIGFFCALSMYSFSDPTDKEFDQVRTDYYTRKLT